MDILIYNTVVGGRRLPYCDMPQRERIRIEIPHQICVTPQKVIPFARICVRYDSGFEQSLFIAH